MMRLGCVVLLMVTSWSAHAAMTLQIVSAPQLTPLWDTLYVAGNFNNWNERDPNYMCVPNGGGWTVSIDGPENMNLEFKFTRGSWSRVEGDATGNYMGNRTAVLSNSILELEIAGWEDLPGTHTISPQVRVLDSNFLIPQLNRSRRIWIRFPEGYTEDDPGYPVMYAMDGQNTMDQATSFAGEWQLDEALDAFTNETCRNAIVVAIDNGGSQRIDEYSPWVNTVYNEGGEGDAFATFLAEHLKPIIDTQFNTLSDASNTMLIGSSLGALIATYTICKYPNTFGKAGLFSPAYWFNPELFNYANTHPLNATSRLYFVSGTTESDDMVTDMQTMQSTILSASITPPTTSLITHTDGAHSEWYWRREFPAAYAWLSNCETTGITPDATTHAVGAIPNPCTDSLVLTPKTTALVCVLLLDLPGKIHLETNNTGSTPTTFLFLFIPPNCLRITTLEGEYIHHQNIIKK